MRPIARMLLLLVLVTATASAQEMWKEYSYRDLHCALSFPGVPKVTTQQVATEAGSSQLTSISYYDPHVGRLTLGYSHTPIPTGFQPLPPDQYLDNVRDDAGHNAGAKVISEEHISVQGYPARLIKLDFQQGMVGTLEIVWVKSTYLYQVLAVRRSASFPEASSNKFLQSFKVLPDQDVTK
jgi:hypothetical protein